MRGTMALVAACVLCGCDGGAPTTRKKDEPSPGAKPPTPQKVEPAKKPESHKSTAPPRVDFETSWEAVCRRAGEEARKEPEETQAKLGRMADADKGKAIDLMQTVNRDGLTSPAVRDLEARGLAEWVQARCLKASQGDAQLRAVLRVLARHWDPAAYEKSIYLAMSLWPTLDPIERDEIVAATAENSAIALTSANTRRLIALLGGSAWLKSR